MVSTRYTRQQKTQHRPGNNITRKRRPDITNSNNVDNNKHDDKHGEVSTGGEVINSGGYGCIFKPALKCKGKSRDRRKVSKLMIIRHSEEEYKLIMKYKKKLEHIPNYVDYFLLEGISMCTPDKLTHADLTYYKKKCTALQKHEITSKNINDNIENVLTINMPDGGVDVGDFLAKHHSEETLIQLNNSLINLLNNGIVPMNKLQIYHCDIKETNILVQAKKKQKREENNKTKLYTRLIDWGISVEWRAGEDIPEKLLNRPLQYNMQFSIILFNKHFLSMYNNLLKRTPSPSYKDIRNVVMQFIMFWFKERGIGHFHAINNILQLLMLNDDEDDHDDMHDELDVRLEDGFDEAFDNDSDMTERKQKQRDDYMFTYYYIADYLTTVLSKYTMHGELNLLKYFNDVFIKNADLWGFIISYATILELYYYDYNKLNKQEIAAFNKIKQIIVSFLFETAITPINVEQLTIELHTLTELFRECKTVPSEYRDNRLRNRTSNVRSIFDNITEDAPQ